MIRVPELGGGGVGGFGALMDDEAVVEHERFAGGEREAGAGGRECGLTPRQIRVLDPVAGVVGVAGILEDEEAGERGGAFKEAA